jgi:cyclopropane fatty-acyl-phospholipid synthase-like methyltransferase
MANKDKAPSQNFFFHVSGTGKGNWEIGRPQQIIIKLVEQKIFQGEVLDIGCGVADNAIYIARHTKNVNITSIDMVNPQLLYLFK